MSAPDPGWYPDPADPTGQRWWDGTAWTDHTAPGAAPTLLPQPQLAYTVEPDTGSRSGATAVLIVVVALVVVGGALALVLVARSDDSGTKDSPDVGVIVPTTVPIDEGTGGEVRPATDAADVSACMSERAAVTTAIAAARVSADTGSPTSPGDFLEDLSSHEYYGITGDSPDTWAPAPIGDPPC